MCGFIYVFHSPIPGSRDASVTVNTSSAQIYVSKYHFQ